MASGLLALLDDIATLIKANAVSLDDISTYSAKASSKATGVVIDDAAVTPNYVVGLSPKRELAIIWAIAKRSFINKLCFLTPIALLLGYFLPWIMPPMLMIGGAYLCFEGYEKVHHTLHPHPATATPDITATTPEALEKERIQGAVCTDMVLSAEIIVIIYTQLKDIPFLTQVIVLSAVATLITVGVYGCVAMIVKADDVGLHLATSSNTRFMQALGRGIVRIMPPFLQCLSAVGTCAMLWVGGEIIMHSIPPLHDALHAIQHTINHTVLAWFAMMLCAALFGITVGWVTAKSMHLWQTLRRHDG
jgi:predicted DNA repair protein MutK